MSIWEENKVGAVTGLSTLWPKQLLSQGLFHLKGKHELEN